MSNFSLGHHGDLQPINWTWNGDESKDHVFFKILCLLRKYNPFSGSFEFLPYALVPSNMACWKIQCLLRRFCHKKPSFRVCFPRVSHRFPTEHRLFSCGFPTAMIQRSCAPSPNPTIRPTSCSVMMSAAMDFNSWHYRHIAVAEASEIGNLYIYIYLPGWWLSHPSEKY